MVGWYHRLDGHEFEQALGIGDGQGSLVCCSPWVAKSGSEEHTSELQSHPTLCDPMNYSTPSFLVLQYLPGFAQTYVC